MEDGSEEEESFVAHLYRQRAEYLNKEAEKARKRVGHLKRDDVLHVLKDVYSKQSDTEERYLLKIRAHDLPLRTLMRVLLGLANSMNTRRRVCELTRNAGDRSPIEETIADDKSGRTLHVEIDGVDSEKFSLSARLHASSETDLLDTLNTIACHIATKCVSEVAFSGDFISFEKVTKMIEGL